LVHSSSSRSFFQMMKTSLHSTASCCLTQLTVGWPVLAVKVVGLVLQVALGAVLCRVQLVLVLLLVVAVVGTMAVVAMALVVWGACHHLLAGGHRHLLLLQRLPSAPRPQQCQQRKQQARQRHKQQQQQTCFKALTLTGQGAAGSRRSGQLPS
jgi:hypothetical protein